MKTIKQAVRALLLFMLILCNIGAYAQKKMEYNIGMVVIRPRKHPATFGILVNLYTFGYKWHKQKKT